MSDAVVRVHPSLAALGQAAAAVVAAELADAVRARGIASIVCSGGGTPLALYAALARRHLDDVPWSHVEFFWGDERYVPPSDPLSNFRLVRDALLVNAPVRPGHVHPMSTSFADPSRAAAAYDALIRARPSPRFDVALLGIGEDGHTASLFPGSDAVVERSRLVVAVEQASADPPRRLTMALPALLDARAIHVLAAGRNKGDALARVWSGESATTCPAAAIRRADAPVTWWLDAAAAGGIPTR
jgi:6-phosphogluconolactonase